MSVTKTRVKRSPATVIFFNQSWPHFDASHATDILIEKNWKLVIENDRTHANLDDILNLAVRNRGRTSWIYLRPTDPDYEDRLGPWRGRTHTTHRCYRRETW